MLHVFYGELKMVARLFPSDTRHFRLFSGIVQDQGVIADESVVCSIDYQNSILPAQR